MLNRILFSLFLFLCGVVGAMAQGIVRGHVLDKQNDEAMQFVNIRVNDAEGKLAGGSMTDVKGAFQITGLKDGQYTLQVSFVGYKPVTRRFQISTKQRRVHFNAIYISEDSHTLAEVQVKGQRSQMKLEVDRKTFTVDEVLAAAGGSVSDLLENIPSIEVTTDGEISLRGNSSVEVWINGKASGLTSDNRGEILQQIPAESIERIEVIDNPSAKYSPEGTAGIINIILKRDRRGGYYGSVQTGVNNQKGWNVGGNINYSSKWVDAYANLGMRRRRGNGGSMSEQHYPLQNTFQNSTADNSNKGRAFFGRAGLTFHLSAADDLSLSGMILRGKPSQNDVSEYDYGVLSTGQVLKHMTRTATSLDGKHRMDNVELAYSHLFNEKGTHKFEASLSYDKWGRNSSTVYQNDTTYADGSPKTWSRERRPMDMNNRSWEAKADYENQLSETFKIEAGYDGRFSHENTPQESQIWNQLTNQYDDEAFFYNRFIYDMDVHALYFTGNVKLGRVGVMAGLRGEYWKVDTKSTDYYQNEIPFKKDYFQLFPSLFLNYDLTETAQLQLNYTRRLRRPWGGQLNSFKNTRDASVIDFGNPELTPEYTNSFSLNFLKAWDAHTLSVGTYYRPTTDVIQRIRYQGTYNGQDVMYMTSLNVAKSQSAGIELIGKDKLWKILDLTTTINGYYYKLDGFETFVEGQKVTGESDENFAWDARLLASVILPYNISVQATGNYRSRSVITQGYRKANGSLDLGLRKTFFNKMIAVALNWRDVFDTRHFENYTEGPTFWRHQRNWRDPRINLQVTWNFGNMMPKKRQNREDGQGGGDDDSNNFGGFEQQSSD
ncbi:MAG: TonB-dependent receptor [Prevotella sp.]|jgi:outer membrane receptor protein involved in Fe transport|nr:TonB-dependent receptor [Prevotella sp.]